MDSVKAIGSGLAGAVALNLVHESLRQVMPFAPRMDKLGQQALSLIVQKMSKRLPSKGELYALTLAGDLVGNALYYALVGSKKSKNTWWKGSLLGAAAGAGALLLPEKMGLNPKFSSQTPKTSLMTFGIYLIGGLVAAGALHLMDGEINKRR